MKRSRTGRALCAFLAALFVVTLLPITALAANLNGLTVSGLTGTYNSGSWSASGNTVNGSVQASFLSSKSGTLTLTNTSGKTKTLSFTYTATPKGKGTVSIDGTTVTGTDTFSKELAANNGSITITLSSGSSGSSNSAAIKLEDVKLISDEPVTTTFIPASGGTYTVDGVAITETTTRTQPATQPYALKATPNAGCSFFAWKSGTGAYLGYDAECSLMLDEPQTVTAVFRQGEAVFGVGSKRFIDLNEAVRCAQSDNVQKIILLENGTLPAGDYTIPNGKILLIPMDDAGSAPTTAPTVTTEAHVTPSAFRTLTMAQGANITVQNGGKICVPSNLSAKGTNSSSWNGTPTGPDGRIVMNGGSSITLESGAGLYCYGYISGSGSVIARSGATVYEAMQFRCWRGGTASSGMNGNSQKVFPLNQYYIQNIEAPLTLESGATEMIYTSVNTRLGAHETSAAFIGKTSGMFRITSGSITKRYDGKTDRLIIDVNGSVSLSAMSLKIATSTVNSADYVLPITNNITINIHSGTTTIDSSQQVALLPGAILTIDNGANAVIGSNLYVYDKDQWGAYAAGGAQLVVVGYSTVNGTTAKRNANSLVDARIDVNGTLTVSGAAYTTQSGAEIISTGKTGRVVLSKAAGTASSTYQVTQSNSDITYVAIPITAAQLKNGDGSYTATAGSAAGTTYFYCATHDKWETGGVNVTFNANGGTGTMPDQTLCPNGSALSANAFTRTDYTFTGWNTKPDGTGTAYPDGATATFTAPTTLYAQWRYDICTITWLNEDGTTIDTTTVRYGETPTHTDPVKEATAEFTYSFAGWMADDEDQTVYAPEELPAATGDATYTAVFSKVKNTYTVTWKNFDGTVLETDRNVPYGATPTYDGEEPSRPGDAQFIYRFDGWDPAVETVAGDAEYTAKFTSIPRVAVTFYADDVQNKNGGAPIELTGGMTDSAGVTQQPNYPSYMGYTLQSATVVSGGVTTEVAAVDNAIPTDAINDAIHGNSATVTVHYAQDMTNTYRVKVVYVLPDGTEVMSYVTDDFVVGNAVQITAAEEKSYNGTTYYFSHWELENGATYDTRVITLRPNEGGGRVYIAKAILSETPQTEAKATAAILNSYSETQAGKHKIAVTMTWTAPEGATDISAGFRVSTTNPKLDNGFVMGTSSNHTEIGTYTLHINRTGKETQPVYICAYLVYRLDGVEHTVLSPVQTLVWE